MKHKRVAAFILAVLSIFLLSGCHLVKLNTERDRAQVVANINGKTITKGEVYDTVDEQYSDYASQMSTMSEKSKQLMYEWALEDMVSYEVKIQKAIELGLDKLSDEKKAEVQKEIDDNLKELRDSIVVPEGTADKDAYIESQMKIKMEQAGLPLDEFRENIYRSAYIELLEQKIKQDTPAPTEDELKLVYNNLRDYQQIVYEQPFSTDEKTKAVQDMFKDTQMAAETLSTTVYTEGSVVIYYPSVEHRQGLYVKMNYSDEIQAQLNTIKNDSKKTDDEKKAESAPLLAKAQAELTQDIAAVQAALEKDPSQDNFKAMIEKYSDDELQAEYIPFGGTVTYMDDKLREEAMKKALFSLGKEGDISAPVFSETGGYIVMLTKIFTPGTVKTYEEVHDALAKYKLKSAQDAAWENQVAAWKEEYKVEMFKGRLFN